MSLEQTYKSELEETLDLYFPKDPAASLGGPQSKSNRAAALVLFATAMMMIRKTITAFGGCERCFGKGYGTQTLNQTTSPDFDGEVEVVEALPTMVFCACARGGQLSHLIAGRAQYP